jgi:hypothetical protein
MDGEAVIVVENENEQRATVALLGGGVPNVVTHLRELENAQRYFLQCLSDEQFGIFEPTCFLCRAEEEVDRFPHSGKWSTSSSARHKKHVSPKFQLLI